MKRSRVESLNTVYIGMSFFLLINIKYFSNNNQSASCVQLILVWTVVSFYCFPSEQSSLDILLLCDGACVWGKIHKMSHLVIMESVSYCMCTAAVQIGLYCIHISLSL
jgi:hypothetical protein